MPVLVTALETSAAAAAGGHTNAGARSGYCDHKKSRASAGAGDCPGTRALPVSAITNTAKASASACDDPTAGADAGICY